jgi:hypothetical protein
MRQPVVVIASVQAGLLAAACVAGLAPGRSVPQAGPLPAVVVGPVSPPVAKTNRQAIEQGLLGGQTLFLPAGAISLDQAVSLTADHSGCTLAGAGPQTVLVSAGQGPRFPLNGTFAILGMMDTVGYSDAATFSPGAFQPVGDLSNYQTGRVVYAWQFNGPWLAGGSGRTRLVVTTVTSETGLVGFQGPQPPDTSRSVKWLRASPIQDVKAGDLRVTLENPDDSKLFLPGQWVYVTDGPSLANEARGEFRRVVALSGNVATLDRPVRQSYTAAGLVDARPVENVTLRDLTLAQPPTGAGPLYFRGCVNLRLERVTLGRPGDPFVRASNAMCGYLTLRDCTDNASVLLNTSHDVLVTGGRYHGLGGEEQCQDVTVRDVLISSAADAVWGTSWQVGCANVTMDNVFFTGCGNIQGHGAIMSDARHSRFLNCRVRDTQPGTPGVGAWCLLAGDRTKLENLESDAPVLFSGGKNLTVRNCQAQGWELQAGTSGRFLGSTPPPNDKTQGGWTVTP